MRKVLFALSLCVAPSLGVAHAAQNGAGIHLAKPPAAAPIYQYRPPAHLPPKSELPTPRNAVGQFFAVQSLNASQDVPTSHKPKLPSCTRIGYVNEYHYHWPTKAQSIQWWKAQPGAPKPGSYAYHVGSRISHQDAEGWVLTGSCVRLKKPNCPAKPGWSGDYTWGNQWTGWQAHCRDTPKPSCPRGPGWTGSVSWNASSKLWVKHCTFVSQPPCPHRPGWTGAYMWNGNTWVRDCTYHMRPHCSSGPGWTGDYTWGGTGWISHCTHHPRPSCPAGDTGSYSWSSSAWVSHCRRAYNGCWTNTETVGQFVSHNYAAHGDYDHYLFSNRRIDGRILSWNGKSYDPFTSVMRGQPSPIANGTTVTVNNGGRIRARVVENNNPRVGANTRICPCNPAGFPTSSPGTGNGYRIPMEVVGRIWGGNNPTMIHDICTLPGGPSGNIP